MVCAAVGGWLFIMLCESPPAKPLLSQHSSCANSVTIPRPHGSACSIFCSSRTHRPLWTPVDQHWRTWSEPLHGCWLLLSSKNTMLVSPVCICSYLLSLLYYLLLQVHLTVQDKTGPDRASFASHSFPHLHPSPSRNRSHSSAQMGTTCGGAQKCLSLHLWKGSMLWKKNLQRKIRRGAVSHSSTTTWLLSDDDGVTSWHLIEIIVCNHFKRLAGDMWAMRSS